MRRLCAVVAMCVVLATALATAGCTSLLFYPTHDYVITPDVIGLAYRDIDFTAADGVRLHGWFLPATGEPQGTILFVHGNAENISTHIASVAWLPAQGFNVLMFDYRGFGLSEGEPTLDGLHLDTVAALDTVFTEPGVDPTRVAVFGQSLGGSVAIASLVRSPHRRDVRALIVEGAFSSYRGIAQEKLAEFWMTWPLQIPLSFTIDNRYKPLEAIAEVSPTPVLIVHGAVDRIVDPGHAQALYAAAGPPKALWLITGASHIQAFQSAPTRQRLVDYLKGCAFAGAPGDAPPAGCSATPVSARTFSVLE